QAPHIVCADADLDPALIAAAAAAFRRTGQSCALGSRVFVQDQVYDAFVERMAARAASVRVGDPLDERTHMGPQAFEEQLQKTERYIRLGREEGARLVWGGERITDPGFRDGYFVRPTVFAEVRNDMRIAQEEIFGPVASLIRFRDEDELVAMANDVVYGLTAGIWTRDVRRAHRVASRLKAGSVRKRAVVAVGHTILGAMYHMLKNKTGWNDLGIDYFDRRNKEAVARRMAKRIEALGYKVTIEEAA
ncbi:MAG: aldehyde dehydrogenase family protein, partial [Clostridia bacterium]|nr:aldehyde dehydrogenase family protein [Clostridia bacterium]